MASTPLLHRIVNWLAGRREHAKAILLFAAVIGLDGADKGAIGAMALPLQHGLNVGKTDLGLLLTISLGVGAAATLPFGWLVDRVNRVRLLTFTVAAWGGAMALSAFATSYLFLLLTRVLLGGVTASAGPAVASLIGDIFAREQRGSVYGRVLSGEILGSGVGFLLAGELATWTWRAGFAALAVPAALLAWVLYRMPEPPRRGAGGESQRRPGSSGGEQASQARSDVNNRLEQLVQSHHVSPRKPLILDEDPRQKSLWWAVKYVLKIPTNRVLILASALGYFYFTGLRAFGVEYLHLWFGVDHAVAVLLLIIVGSGSLVGVLVSGRLADRLLASGHLRARVDVAVGAYAFTAGVFLVALFPASLWLGVPLIAAAAAGLGAINPPLDAARLDIMHPRLWGRAEAVRTFLRKSGEASAPLVFGYLSETVFAGDAARGLHATFLVMVGVLGAGALIAFKARHPYPRDVATAEASARRTSTSAGRRAA